MTTDPTPAQLAVLRELAAFTDREGIAPSIRDLCFARQITNNALVGHLRGLERKGLVRRRPGVARGTTITEAGRRCL
jgi:DNA-binding MarR family transcriptional regulator